jgi:hypothetical protein
MKTFFRLFWQELKDLRLVFAAAALLATLSFVLEPVVDLGIRGDSEGAIGGVVSMLFLLMAPWALGTPWLTARSSDASLEPQLREGDWRLFASPLLARLLAVVLGSWLPMSPEILASFEVQPGEFGKATPADIPWAFAQWTLMAMAIFVLVQAGHFLVRDRSWRSLLDLAPMLLFVGLVRFTVWLIGPGQDPFALLTAFLAVWSASGLFSAWLAFKTGPPIAQAHRRYSLSMIFSLLVLGAGGVLTTFVVSALK